MSRLLIGTGPSPTSGDFEEAFAPIRARYLGRQYRIDGQIPTVTRDIQSLEMDMNYLVTVTRRLLGVRQESSFNDLNFQIKCRLAKGQAAFFATPSEGNWVTLKERSAGSIRGACNSRSAGRRTDRRTQGNSAAAARPSL